MYDPQKSLGNSIKYVHFQETRKKFESYSIDLVLAFSKEQLSHVSTCYLSWVFF